MLSDTPASDVTKKSLARFAPGWPTDCYIRSMKYRPFTHQFYARQRDAFTLIELLTVIAIIGILAAIIIPTVGKVRESARYSIGTSNLREWARANILFAQENKGFIPNDGATNAPTAGQITPVISGAGPWWNELPPYISQRTLKFISDNRGRLPTLGDNNIFICPNASAKSVSTAPAWLCYAPAFPLSEGGANARTANVNRIRNPSRTVLFAETTNHAPGQTGSFPTSNPRALGTSTATTSGSRWGGKSLVSFFDGSVKSFSQAQLLAQGEDLKGLEGGVIWDPYP